MLSVGTGLDPNVILVFVEDEVASIITIQIQRHGTTITVTVGITCVLVIAIINMLYQT